MSIDAVTHNPYAYLERDLPNAPTARYEPAPKADGKNGEMDFGKDGFGFGDFLDIINPLQHIPGVASIYREVTGDEISPGARVIGDTIYGGGIGLVAGVVNSAVEEATGKDIGGNLIALFSGGEDGKTQDGTSAPNVMIASRGLSSGSAEDGPQDIDYISLPAGNPLPAGATLVAETPGEEAVSAVKETPAAPAATVPVRKSGPAIAAAPKTEGLVPEEPVPPAPHATPAPETSKPATTLAAEPHLAPIGLKWRGKRPDLVRDIEKAQKLQTPNLTEAQMEAVLKSFRLAPGTTGGSHGGHGASHITPPTISTPRLTAAEAAANYRKTSAFAAHPEQEQQLFPAKPAFKP